MVRSRNNILAFCLALLPLFAFPDVGGLAESYAKTYFAPQSVLPCGIWRMRTAEGGIRQFESVGDGSMRLKSADGWFAEIVNAGKVVVTSPGGIQPALKVVYERGKPSSVEIDGKPQAVVQTGPVVYSGEEIQPCSWPSWWAESLNMDLSGVRSGDVRTWWAGNRLTMWFLQPNQAGAFFAMLLSLAVVLVFRARKRLWTVAGIVLSLLAFAGVILTQSRSSLIAAVAVSGLVAVCHLHGRGWFTRRRIGIALLVFAVIGVAACGVFAGFSSRGEADYRQSNDFRRMIWKAFPRMMCDAPWGWGIDKVGKAYSDWYCPEDHWFYRKNLVSDHLTTMVSVGWLGSGVYVFLWLIGLLALLRLAWKGCNPAPLAAWSVLAITSFFNVILSASTILWVPVLSLIPLLFDRQWLKGRFWIKPVLCALVCTCGILLVVCQVGERTGSQPRIYKRGPAVAVNGDRPRIWLVADDDVLGSSVMPREEVRGFYRVFPEAPAVGIVGSLDDLGKGDVRRLVLSGRHGAEFLARHRGDSFQKGIPPEVIFLSPGFSATEVPLELRARARVSVVTGEFAARYQPGMTKPPEWAKVVPGAELYITGWMRYFVPVN